MVYLVEISRIAFRITVPA